MPATAETVNEQIEGMIHRIKQSSTETLGKAAARRQLLCFDAFPNDYQSVERCQMDSAKELEEFWSTTRSKLSAMATQTNACLTLCRTPTDDVCKERCYSEALKSVKLVETQSADMIKQRSV